MLPIDGSLALISKIVLGKIPRISLSISRKISSLYWVKIFGIGGQTHTTEIGFGCVFMFPHNYVFGDHVSIEDYVRITSEIEDAYIQCDSGVQLSRGTTIDFTGGVSIGKNALISKDVSIITHSHGLNPRSEPTGMALNIESGVWIGQRAMILESVSKIGENSIVGAGAVLTKDVPAGEIWCGVPAKPIGRR